jgi:hypothetical protein
MKKKAVLFPTVFAVCLAALTFHFVFGKDNAYAQMSTERTLVSKTASTSSSVGSSASLSRFAPAAAENTKLRGSLAWAFGGKVQNGWNIYSDLIGSSIGTDASPDSPLFAQSLSKWQASHALEPTGVLDESTMSAFVKYWQSRRLGKSGFPGDDRLYTAPISEFYDQTRDANLLQLEKETFAAYKRMLAAASKDLKGSVRFTPTGELAPGEKFLRIVSAYRSPEYQAALRRKEPNAGRGALAKFSAHSTGQALDLYVGGEPVSTKDPNRLLQVQTPAYKWLVKNAHKFGFYPYFYEPWHWEYVPAR